LHWTGRGGRGARVESRNSLSFNKKCGKNCEVVHTCMTIGKYEWEFFCKSKAVPGEGPEKPVACCSNLDVDICISFWILSKSLQF